MHTQLGKLYLFLSFISEFYFALITLNVINNTNRKKIITPCIIKLTLFSSL